MNIQKIVDTFCNELDSRNYPYNRNAVNMIVNKSIAGKKHLIEMFSSHELWDEEQLCIHFDKDYERYNNVSGSISNFLSWIYANARRAGEDKDPRGIACLDAKMVKDSFFWRNESLMTVMESLPSAKILPEYDEYAEIYKDRLDAINALNPGKWNFRPGMKINRVLNKIAQFYGWDKVPGYDDAFAQFSDGITPYRVMRHTTISVNPIDFLLMSNGNSWHSCHYIGEDKDDAGCYSSGTISYMLDPHSFIVSIIDKEWDNSNLALAPKIMRQVFGYNDYQLLQSRLYPQKCDSGAEETYKNIREVVEEIIAKAEGEANRWVKCKDINVEHDGTCYPDWEYNRICNMYKLRSHEDIACEPIEMGKDPICIVCGGEHNYESNIVCEDCKPVRCSDCGCEIDLSDTDSYVERGGYYYCTECRFICERCGDLETVDNKIWISDDEEEWCDYCARRYAWQCEDCDEWFASEDYIELADGSTVCERCCENSYMQCEKCGEYYQLEDMTEHDGSYYCPDCLQEIEEEEEANEQRAV